MRVLVAIVSLLAASSAAAAQELETIDPVSVEAVWSSDHARPGDQRVLAVVFRLEPTWHINPDAGRISDEFAFLIPTTIEVADAPRSLQLGPAQFPEPREIEVNYTGTPKRLLVYEDVAVMYVPVLVAPDAPLGEADVQLSVRYQTCDDTRCLFPKTVTLDATLTITDSADAARGDTDVELFSGFDRSAFGDMLDAADLVEFDVFDLRFAVDASTGFGFVLLLATAALGGFLLNLTPCVLPVIPIKIMSLANASHDSRARTFVLGLVMVLGVLGFWMSIGAAIAFVAGFDAVNELFQWPAFTIGVGAVIAVMAVAMCGLFAFKLPNWVYAINPKQGTIPGSFGFGVMTAVLSTPCTAPFMGTAAAWATTQPPHVTLATFFAIGSGMGLPYLVLAIFPRLVDRVPRTGPGSELLKQIMGLFMLAAASYFVGTGINGLTADGLAATSQVYWLFVYGFIGVAGLWLCIRAVTVLRSKAGRTVFAGIGGAVMIAAVVLVAGQLRGERIKWVYYTPTAFQQQVDAGNVVVMDFTADWCINCKVLESSVLESDAIVSLLDQPDIVPMKVDITSQANVDGAAMLERMGSVTIPLLVVFDTAGEPVFKSDFYTIDQVERAIADARER